MSKFIQVTQKNGSKILVAIEQIEWVADDIEKADTLIYLLSGNVLTNISESAKDIFVLLSNH